MTGGFPMPCCHSGFMSGSCRNQKPCPDPSSEQSGSCWCRWCQWSLHSSTGGRRHKHGGAVVALACSCCSPVLVLEHCRAPSLSLNPSLWATLSGDLACQPCRVFSTSSLCRRCSASIPCCSRTGASSFSLCWFA